MFAKQTLKRKTTSKKQQKKPKTPQNRRLRLKTAKKPSNALNSL
jgi:hypothetical protein